MPEIFKTCLPAYPNMIRLLFYTTCLILSCTDVKVIVQKTTLESNLNLSNKVDINAPNAILDSISLTLVKTEFKNIAVDSVYSELIGNRQKCNGFQYSIDSGNFGVAKCIDSDSVKLIHFYNQLDLATENLRPSFTLYYFVIDKKTIVVNTFTDKRTIYFDK